MSNSHLAVIACERPNTVHALTGALRALAVRPFTAGTYGEVKRLVSELHPPVVFTGTALPGGTWMDVVRIARSAPEPVNVIVIGEIEDMQLYISALGQGAVDFVLPPFEANGLKFVVNSAVRDAALPRQAKALAREV